MTFLTSCNFFRVLVVAIGILIWVPLPARAKPAVQPYPGAIAADHAVSEMQRPYVRVYYSRDPVEKVNAFYEQKLGSPEELRYGEESHQTDTGRRPVNTYRYVIYQVIPLEKAALHPDRVAVEISTPRPRAGETEPPAASVPPELAESDLRCRPPSDFFEPLFTMVVSSADRTWDQFNEICRRYHHLNSSLFFPSSEQDERGRTLNQAQAMIRQYHADTAPPVADSATMEELAEQMQAMAMAGRIEEARALAQKMSDGMRAPGTPVGIAGGQVSSDWDEWIELLEEIDRHAYRTRIMINTDPATWPDRIRLRENHN